MKRQKLNGKALRTLVADDPVQLEQAREVWVLRVKGREPFDIATELGLPTHRVKKILEVCMEEFTDDIQSAVAQERALDISRVNQLLETYLPISKETDADSWKVPVQAAEIVIRAIETRSKLFGYDKQEGPTVTHNHAYFLNGETIRIAEQFVQAAPLEIADFDDADVLELDVEFET